MTNQEAKFILTGYRPSGRDAGDATFCDAVNQTQNDPQLAAWFKRAQAHDAAVAAKLDQIAPPAGLREAILAGARFSGTARAWWRQPQWFAAAAVVAILLSVVAVWRASQRETALPTGLAAFALDDMVNGKHGGHGDAKVALQRWLGDADTKLVSAAMPLDFEQLRTTGCRTLRHDGHDVIEVCFVRSGAEFHLYVIRREDMPELPARAVPAMIARTTGAAAVWSDRRNHYALVSDAGADAVRRLL